MRKLGALWSDEIVGLNSANVRFEAPLHCCRHVPREEWKNPPTRQATAHRLSWSYHLVADVISWHANALGTFVIVKSHHRRHFHRCRHHADHVIPGPVAPSGFLLRLISLSSQSEKCPCEAFACCTVRSVTGGASSMSQARITLASIPARPRGKKYFYLRATGTVIPRGD